MARRKRKTCEKCGSKNKIEKYEGYVLCERCRKRKIYWDDAELKIDPYLEEW